jgi:TolB-like protein/cytochrome c-type biogenesis protein CcmH/NrfG
MGGGLSRKLAVILHADVVGSTRLVQLDETLAHERIRDAFKRFSDTIGRYHGIAHEIRGDALVAEFSMTSDAVSAALAFQLANAAHVEELMDAVRPVVRVGIAMGEVVVADNTVTGAGVVLAQRLEQFAKPGGIVIQGAAYETVPRRLPFDYETLGELELKGFDGPVRAFAVTLRPGADLPKLEPQARQAQQAPGLPDKPSIAVLPFTNMSGDPEQEYFADGISEDIITGLSRFHWFFVIARNSSFAYKGGAVDIKQVARELGVQYVLEGSVRKSGERVRISAQLIDATTGRHVWAERYDRKLEDIFAVQDEISEAITTTVAPAFVSAEARRAERKAPENLDAWDYAMRGNWHLSRRGKDDLAEARRLFEQALQLDPKNTMALSGLAFALCWVDIFGWEEDLEAVRARAYDAARQAVGHDDNDAWAHAILGWVRFTRHELDAAVAECRRALDLNPSLALAESILSISYSWYGDNDEALKHAERAERLSPRDPAQSMWSFARSCAEFGVGNYEQAVQWARLATDVMPDFPGAWRYLAASLGHLDRLEEARAAVHHLLAVLPHDNLRRVRTGLHSVRPERMERFVEGLRKAGLPE